MNLKITGTSDDWDMWVRRLHHPFTLTSECPTCGHVEEQFGGDFYLSYPVCGVPIEIEFSHEFKDADGEWIDHTWKESVVIGLVMEPAP
jgi:hypothetical protein